MTPRRVIKIGGSLLTHASLVDAVERWLREQVAAQEFIIVGGGQAIDAMRGLAQRFALDEAAMHWRCIRLLRATYEVAAELFGDWQRIERVDTFEALGEAPRQPGRWLIAVDTFYSPATGNDAGLPEGWATTTDAIAAYLARRTGADELVLLKSCHVDPSATIEALAADGVVDPALPAALPKGITLRIERLT